MSYILFRESLLSDKTIQVNMENYEKSPFAYFFYLFSLQKDGNFKNGNYLNVSFMYISTYIFSF